MQSFRADDIISTMSSKLEMCTGIFKSRSHVDVVGLHLQLASHPCTKVMENFLEKPSTGTVFVPVIHLTKSLMAKSPVE